MPARRETRSPSASSRINCACISPSLRAIALTLSRTNRSLRATSSRIRLAAKSCRIGILNSLMTLNVATYSPVTEKRNTSVADESAIQNRRGVSVRVTARVRRGSTTIICTDNPPALRRDRDNRLTPAA
jgi:hypothetical protein